MTLVLSILILIAALLGTPLFLVIAAGALVGFLGLGGGGAVFASLIEPVRTVTSQDIFLAIPLFTFAGFLMAAAGTPTRLVNISKAVLGWMPGGIAIVALVACAFFTAFTGASGVTIIALGGLLFPILLKEQYPENFSLGLLTTGGSRGLVFPPSLPLILFATIAAVTFSPIVEERRAAGPPDDWLVVVGSAEAPAAAADAPQDVDDELDDLLGDDDDGGDAVDDELDALLDDDAPVAAPALAAVTKAPPPWDQLVEVLELTPKAASGDSDSRRLLWNTAIEIERNKKPTPEKLFVAGAIPGTLMIILIGLYAVFLGARRKVPRTPFSFRTLGRALREGAWELPIPFLILVGIYGGFFTAQEAAGVTAFYVLIVEVFIYRDIPFKKLPKVMLDSMILVGGVMAILILALAFKDYLVFAEVPQFLRDSMRSWISDPITFLLLLNVFLLVVGCLMDIFSAIMVVVPLIVPLAVEYGVHPVHLGIIFLTNLEIGYSTPPVGINLFIASLRFRRPILQLYAACLPFLGILLASLLLITYWPDLSMWLVHLTGME